MRLLSLVLFSFSGILALQNGSDNGGVEAALMPKCAVNCIKEHVPNSGCNLLHITCLCDPDFRVKHGHIIAPCLIALCDANEINKVQNAWRGQYEAVPSTPNDRESVKSELEEGTSNAAVASTSANDDDIDAKVGPQINTTEIDTKTNPNTNAKINFELDLEFNLERNFKYNVKLNPKANAHAHTEIINEFNDEFNQLTREWNGIHKLDNDQHSHRSIKTNPNPD
ncbi:hypothetical protein CDV31_015874 [Fusarium ambrosium]|uniref:CFEM domain-containing protein n=1 Tax=Fusarium ambrosium TaxID=131363 RepID=A0A428SI54_9HYPO|nr:hypothetical protein CDV31_015874 [Fusarium ambrosium]